MHTFFFGWAENAMVNLLVLLYNELECTPSFGEWAEKTVLSAQKGKWRTQGARDENWFHERTSSWAAASWWREKGLWPKAFVHQGHWNQALKPCSLKKCTEYIYCGIKEKHPEFFSKLNSLKLQRKKRKDAVGHLESQLQSMEQFSTNSEHQFAKNLAPRMYNVDESYKKNKPKLMRCSSFEGKSGCQDSTCNSKRCWTTPNFDCKIQEVETTSCWW